MEFRKQEMVLVVLTLTAAVLHVVLSADQNITAEPGENITLPCRSADNRSDVVVQWDRDGLESGYVLLYRDQFDPVLQHPSFKNRVDLQDRQMKDGDVSLVLNNVTTNDAGTYECRVQSQGTRENIITSIVHLQVPPGGPAGPGQDGGHQDGGHQDGGHQDGGHQDGGHQDGGHQDGGHQDGGHQDGDRQRLIVYLVLFLIGLIFFVIVIIRWCHHHFFSPREPVKISDIDFDEPDPPPHKEAESVPL